MRFHIRSDKFAARSVREADENSRPVPPFRSLERRGRPVCRLLPRSLHVYGGVCHGSDEHATYRKSGKIIAQEVSELEAAGEELPPAITRPMREAIGV